jgi:hypothetical protein
MPTSRAQESEAPEGRKEEGEEKKTTYKPFDAAAYLGISG